MRGVACPLPYHNRPHNVPLGQTYTTAGVLGALALAADNTAHQLWSAGSKSHLGASHGEVTHGSTSWRARVSTGSTFAAMLPAPWSNRI